MLSNVLLVVGAVSFGAVAFVSGLLNANTPIQLGPIPVVGGALLSLLCLVALAAMHIVWK